MIQTRSLQYTYPGGTALVFPDVDVAQGAVLLLSGPSGCGKSTWLALVAGLVAPASGDVTVAGQPLVALKNIASDAWRAKTIGFLPQKLHLSAHGRFAPKTPVYAAISGSPAPSVFGPRI